MLKELDLWGIKTESFMSALRKNKHRGRSWKAALTHGCLGVTTTQTLPEAQACSLISTASHTSPSTGTCA